MTESTEPNRGAPQQATAQAGFLGGFSLRIGDAELTDELNRSTKLWTLLSYMIVHRGRTVPQSEYIELLWPDGEREGSPGAALKALFFRLRRMLSGVFGDLPLIVSHHSTYSWSRDIDCLVDCEQFEALCKLAGSADAPTEVRLARYREAVDLYRGAFLPKFSAQLWAISYSAYYHNLYLEAVKGYAALLTATEQHREIGALCLMAIPFDPLDEELHLLLLRSQLAMGQHAAALSHYESATEHFARSLGISPSPEMQQVYREIMSTHEAPATDLSAIQRELAEPDPQHGAYYCELGFFREAFRINARQSVRSGMSIHLVLLTLQLWDGRVPDPGKAADAMETLHHEIRRSLRSVDLFSRFSNVQYLLLLPRANYEDSLMVAERVVDAFARHARFRKLRLTSKVAQLESDAAPPQ